MTKLSRLVEINNTNFHTSFQYINYVLSTNALTVRLLRNTSRTEAGIYEDDLYNTEQVFSNSFIQAIGVTVPYNGKMLEIIAEATLDYDEYPKEAKQPLSTFLIYLTNNELKVDNYLLNTSINHYRSSDYLRSLSGSAICLAQVYFINANDTISDSSISLVKLNGIDIISNIDMSSFIKETAQVAADRNTPKSRFQPKLILSSSSDTVEEDAEVTFRITCELNNEVCTEANFIVHIEPVDGYVAHKRVTLQNGEATFTAQALNLKDGETMRIKVGLPHYTGLAEKVVNVVAKSKEESKAKTPEELILEMKAAVLSAEEIKKDIKDYSENLINSGISKTLNEFSALKTAVEKVTNDLNKSIIDQAAQQVKLANSLQEAYKTELNSALDRMQADSKDLLAELGDLRNKLVALLDKINAGEPVAENDFPES